MYPVQRGARELLSLHGFPLHLKQRAWRTWLKKMHLRLGTFEERIESHDFRKLLLNLRCWKVDDPHKMLSDAAQDLVLHRAQDLWASDQP